MSVLADILALNPQGLVEMFEFNPTNIGRPAGEILRWHPGTQIDREPIVWKGVTYTPYPVEGTGFEMTAAGKLPRPVLRASNIGGELAAFLRAMEGGLGAKVTRYRTLAKYLDPINFPGGNPNADRTTEFEPEIFYLARKASENPIYMEFELAVPFDVRGIKLPRRQVIAGTCQWVYRSPACSYAGGAVLNDPVFPGVDKCGKGLASCKLRFGANGILRTSAFPSSLLARYV